MTRKFFEALGLSICIETKLVLLNIQVAKEGEDVGRLSPVSLAMDKTRSLQLFLFGVCWNAIQSITIQSFLETESYNR